MHPSSWGRKVVGTVTRLGRVAWAAGVMALAITVAGVSTVPDPPGSDRSTQGCSRTGSRYYAFDLIPTKRVPGTGLAQGLVEVKLSESSPFAVALTEDGSYRYEIHIGVERAKSPKEGDFVAWVTTPELDRVERVGTLDQDMAGTLRVTGAVEWNKFIVVISLELTDDPAQERWSGPVAFRGMSRSGAMHTMVGHGALQQENCAAWGY